MAQRRGLLSWGALAELAADRMVLLFSFSRLCCMTSCDILGSATARLILYLPHRPVGLETFAETPTAQAVTEANSNHWRKIINLLAKVASPEGGDWRRYRDHALFTQTAICFAPQLLPAAGWHWIAGKENLHRFEGLAHQATPIDAVGRLNMDVARRLLLSPYPDYRQLSNERVAVVREALVGAGFYGAGAC